MIDVNLRNAAIEQFNQSLTVRNTDKELGGRLLLSSVQLDPDFADGWNDLGISLFAHDLRHAAVAAYRRALSAPQDGNSGSLSNVRRGQCLTNLSHTLMHMGRLEEAKEAAHEAIKFEDNPAYAFTNLSLIHSVQGDVVGALDFAKRAFEAKRDHLTEMALAFAYLNNKDWISGLKHYEARFPYKQQQYLNFPFARWNGERLDGKTLFVVAEQGLGDTLSFLRFLPMTLASGAAKVVCHVQPETLRLMRWMFGNEPRIEAVPLGMHLPAADAWTPFTSLPLALGLTNEQVERAQTPPIPWHGLPVHGYEWKAPGRKLHIGIAWKGSPQNDIDRWRSIELHHFLELYRVPGVQLYSLQKTDGAKELNSSGCSGLIRDLSPYITDVVDTLEIMRALDLVITVESSPGHMAGLIGAECWIPYSLNGGDWRLGRTEAPPLWYPNHKIFRQGPDAAWGPVFNRMVEALRQRVAP